MAAPELRLKVTLDTSFLKGQISRLPLDFAGANVSIRPKFDRQTIASEFRLLNRYIGSKKFNITITSNLEAEIKNADRLVQALGRVQQAASGAKGGLPIGTQVLSRTKTKGGFAAAEIKALFGAAVQGGLIDDKTLASTRAQMVTALGSIGRDSIAGLLNGLKSGDADIQNAAKLLGNNLITSFKTVLGIASPSREFKKIGESAGQGFEQGLLKSIEIAEQSATRKMQRMLDRLARMALMMSGMSGPEIGRQVAQARALPSLNFGATTPRSSVSIGPSSSGRMLPAAPSRTAIAGAPAPAGLLPSLSSAGQSKAIIEALIASTGPRLLPSGGGDDSLGKLAAPRQTKDAVDAILRNYFKVVEAQVKEVFSAPPIKKESLNIFDHLDTEQYFNYLAQARVNAENAIKRSIEEAKQVTKQNQIKDAAQSFLRALEETVRNAERSAFTQSRIAANNSYVQRANIREIGQPLLGGRQVAPPKMLSAATGFYRGAATPPPLPETQAQLFARREREARMRSVLRGVDVMGETPTRAPARYSYANRPAMPRRPTSAIVPYEAGGAIVPSGGGGGGFPSDGMIGPSATKGYEALTRLSGALRQSSAFFNQAKIPLAGAVEGLGGEFAQAAKQVLLYGTAYKALAFFTSLPQQVLAASTSLQTFNNQLLAITGSSAGAERSFAFVDNLATRFNVPLESARQGFVRLYASMAPAGFEAGQIEALYTGISKASATLGLSADKVDRVTYAFAQMSSKGQLMAEEVTGQLGDVIPGALSLMAEAARMDIATFKKAMEDGAFVGKAFEQVMSNVPIVLEQRFGKGAAGAAKTLQGSMNALSIATTKFYESFNAIVQSGGAAIFPVIADAIDQATKAATAFSAAATGNMGPANMLEGTAKNLYIAMRQLQEIFIAIGNVVKGIAPTFVILGQSVLGLLSALSQLTNTAVGRFLVDLAVKAGVALIAIQLLTKTGVMLLASQLAILFRNAQLAGTGMLGFARALGATATAAKLCRLALIGLGAGLVLMGIQSLIEHLDRAANRLGNMRKAALDAAGAIRSMSSAELVQDKTKRQRDIALLERVQSSGGNIGSEDERKRLEEMGLQTGTRGVQRRVMDPSLIESYLQKERQLLSEVNYAYKNLDQPPSALGEVDITGGKAGTGKPPKEQSLESYYSLQDQLAKAQTQADIDRIEALFEHRKNMINSAYDLEEARANSVQKEAIAHQRAISSIFMDLQKKQINARLSMMKAEGSVAGGAGAGAAPGSAVGAYLQGDIGPTSTGPHFDVKKVGGGYFPRNYLDQFVQVNGRPLSSGTTVPGGTFAGHQRRGSHGWDYAFGEGRHAATLTGGAKWQEGVPTQHGERRRFQLPSGEMFQFLHGGSEGIGAKTPGKVTPDQKREVLADQAKVITAKQATLSITHAEIEAQRQLVVETEKYLAQIFGVAEKELQAGMLQKKTAMLRAGATDQEIEDAMSLEELNLKYAAGVEAANRQIAFNNQLKEKGLISQEELNDRNAYQNLLIEKLNKELPKATQAQLALNKATKEYAFTGVIKTLQEEIKLLLIINDEERRIAELRKTYSASEAQEIFNLEKIKKNIEDTRALIDGFVSSTTSDYKGFLKAVISGEDAADALKQFQEGLTDRVLTIFLDFAMAPVEKFLKESLEGLFLPKIKKEAGKLPEATTKDPVEATNSNTNATVANTVALDKVAAALTGAAGQNQSTSLASTVKSIGLSSGIDTSLNGLGGLASAGLDAASIFGNPEALTGAFGGVQASISESMDGIVSSFESGAFSLANTLPSWNDSLTTKLPAALTASTSKTESAIPAFQESLGKVAQGIGIAAGAIMGIAAGISQIKKGGTSNVLGGIGSILMSIGGGISGFMSLGKAANGAVWKGGFQAFANGGMVSGPTLGLIGEGKYNEAIVPLPDGRSIPVQMTGANGGGSLRDAMNSNSGASSSPVLNMSFQSTSINGVEYVSRDQLESAMAETRRNATRDGAKRGMTMTLDRIQNSSSTRRKVGI